MGAVGSQPSWRAQRVGRRGGGEFSSEVASRPRPKGVQPVRPRCLDRRRIFVAAALMELKDADREDRDPTC